MNEIQFLCEKNKEYYKFVSINSLDLNLLNENFKKNKNQIHTQNEIINGLKGKFE